jgi:YidC/Oxa1 family membrane protein insertase
LFAIVLIFATVAFFSGNTWQKFYYNKILHEPLPATYVSKAPQEQGTATQAAPPQNAAIAETPPPHAAASASVAPSVTIDTIWVETDKIIAGISERGARIVSLQMKEYNSSHLSKAKVAGGYVDLIAKKSAGGAGLSINNSCYDDAMFSPESAIPGNRIEVAPGSQASLTLVTRDPGSGASIKKQFSFSGDDYKIGFNVSSDQLNNSKVTVSWPAGIAESEMITSGSSGGRGGITEERVAHYCDGTDVEHVKSSKDAKEDHSGFYKWVGVSSKYFFEAIVADTLRDADITIISLEDTNHLVINGKRSNTKLVNYSISYQMTTQGNTASFWFYGGPSRYMDLKKYGLEFQKIMFPVLGWTKMFFWADKWFPPIAEFILWVLLILFKVTKDYGVSILLLTVLSRVVTYPLTQSSMKSMNRMKDLQPKINAIRTKYKSNPQKLNEATMALYKAEGVNPLNPGCLPMFLQMPIFLALFVVLRKAIELRGAGTVLVPWVHDLSQPESVFYFGNLLPGGIPMYGSNFAIIPLVMALLTYFQNKMTIKDPNQKMMIYFMPIFMLALFNNFASGLVLYWTLSSGLGLLQQYFLNKSSPGVPVVVQGSGATPGRSDRPAMHRK